MDFLILRPLPPKTGYHFFEGGWGGVGVGVGGGGGQKFLLNRLQAVGTHVVGSNASGPMVTQRTAGVQPSVRILVCKVFSAAAAGGGAKMGSGVRTGNQVGVNGLRYHSATTWIPAQGIPAAWGRICH